MFYLPKLIYFPFPTSQITGSSHSRNVNATTCTLGSFFCIWVWTLSTTGAMIRTSRPGSKWAVQDAGVRPELIGARTAKSANNLNTPTRAQSIRLQSRNESQSEDSEEPHELAHRSPFTSDEPSSLSGDSKPGPSAHAMRRYCGQ